MSSEVTITLPLDDYLHDLIREDDSVKVYKWKAQLIAALLVRAELHLKYHIQFLDTEGKELIYPRLWLKKDWDLYIGKYLSDKRRSELARREANLLTENTSLLIKTMAKETGIENADEIFSRLAKKLAKNKNIKLIEQVFKTKIDT